MVGQRFRLTRSTIAIRHSDGESGCTTIPENAVVLVEGFHDADRLVRVRWDNEEVLIFARDLREHSSPVAAD